jgi:hypothetical protein
MNITSSDGRWHAPIARHADVAGCDRTMQNQGLKIIANAENCFKSAFLRAVTRPEASAVLTRQLQVQSGDRGNSSSPAAL